MLLQSLPQALVNSCEQLNLSLKQKSLNLFWKRFEANYPPGFISEANLSLNFDRFLEIFQEF